MVLMKRGIKLKKLLLIILCILISISFAACNNDSKLEDHDTVSENISIQNDDTSKAANNKDKNNNNNNGKSITRLYISYSGINMDITTDESKIAELLELEKNATVPETKLSTKFADITAVYDDNTEEIYGTIYIGEDNGYYLEFANSTVEGAAYKMSDSSLGTELF